MRTHKIKWTMDHFLIWLFRIHGSQDTNAAIKKAREETRKALILVKQVGEQHYQQGYQDCKKAMLALQPLREVPIAEPPGWADPLIAAQPQTTGALPKSGELKRVIGTETMPAVYPIGELARMNHRLHKARLERPADTWTWEHKEGA